MVRLFKNKRHIVWLLLFFTAAAFCAVCIFVFLKVPTRVEWQEKEQEISGGGICSLHHKRFSLEMSPGDGVKGPFFWSLDSVPRVQNATLWQTPKGWLVQDFLVTDLDGDDDKELILLVWKRGRFGPDRPFWVNSDEKSYSQHIFIYDVDEDLTVREKWLASEIGPVVRRFKLMEKNPSILLTEAESGNCSLWKWGSWGLKSMENSVSFIAFGDNLIHESILEYGLKTKGGDFSFLYEPFLSDIKEADIAALNSETPLVDRTSAYGGYPSFGTPTEVGEAVYEAGFDIAACANNHCLDRGMYGIDITSSFYRDKNIVCLGIHGRGDGETAPCEYISRNGMTFALFNYTYGTNGIDVSKEYPDAVNYLPSNESEESALVSKLKKARENADAVIVFVHWGEEYSKEISEEQKHFAKLFAEGGADLVIGSHPHVLQEMSLIDRPDGSKMLVYYSLGNFRANQGDSADTRLGGEARVTFEHCYDGVRIADYELKEIDAYWK